MKQYTEATRVQMPAMVHLTRLGYNYFGKISEEQKNKVFDPETNILIEVFKEQFARLNPGHEAEAELTLRDISMELGNDDLGRAFYKRLKSISPTRIIDFENPKNNSYHFTAEFTCKNGQDEFRPDITLFVNGLPLVFIEVKKPYNHGGMVEESKRMNNQRFPNKKFRKFINITQFMLFSNNMEYDTAGGIVPIQGVFYCTAARKSAPFNCFREENPANQPIAPFNNSYPYMEVDPDEEKHILADFNNQVIHSTAEYRTNTAVNTPTNRVLTSMCCPERLLFILKYGIAYVKMEREVDGKIESTDQKHIMRYQQLFAALAIRQQLSEGTRAGVVWHTQGSGKTALSYYLTHVLADYFARQNQVAKFYFIVDRIDLLEQAMQEFEARGLVVATANSREELMAQFRNNQALQGNSGQAEITVVNIQRFAENKDKVELPAYATNLQRVFIMDEAHRGYKPGGCFLANLFEADPSSIKIALTGTPLLKEDVASSKVFSKYLHTYYYDRSIADGYTLKIIREEIETSYKERLSEVYDQLDHLVLKKEITKAQIVEHPNYVRELAKYIEHDLRKFRQIKGDETLGGMVICETSTQAKELYKVFCEFWNDAQPKTECFRNDKGETVYLTRTVDLAADAPTRFGNRPLKAGLILHDIDDKETRKQVITDFKKNMTVDLLIVFNMLLTGFDAPRLKRLYFGRKLKDHNLLQALTRVNRPYKDNRYGYLIDFANIKQNFRQTNEAYLQELNRYNDVEGLEDSGTIKPFVSVIEDPDELIRQMQDVRNTLFEYTTNNVEEFCNEIATIEDKKVLLDLKRALTSAKDCANIVRTFGNDELKATFAKLEITRLPDMLKEVQRSIDTINLKLMFEKSEETQKMVYEAMADIKFNFSKIGEEQLNIVSREAFEAKWASVIRAMTDNSDQDDPEYITLRDAFMQRFKEHGFTPHDLAVFDECSRDMDDILKRLTDLQNRNQRLMKKYNGDAKFSRVHKRIREENERRLEQNRPPVVNVTDDTLSAILNVIKGSIDQKVYDKNDILKKDAYFEQTVLAEVANSLFAFPQLQPDMEDYTFIQSRIARQYMNQYRETYPA